MVYYKLLKKYDYIWLQLCYIVLLNIKHALTANTPIMNVSPEEFVSKYFILAHKQSLPSALQKDSQFMVGSSDSDTSKRKSPYE